MDIHLRVDQAKPLLGRIRVSEANDGQAFAGWLELLRALSDAIANDPPQLDAAVDAELGE